MSPAKPVIDDPRVPLLGIRGPEICETAGYMELKEERKRRCMLADVLRLHIRPTGRQTER